MHVPSPKLTPHTPDPGHGLGVAVAKIPWGEASKLAHQQALRLLNGQNRPLAEDIAQASLLKLYQNAARIRVCWKALLSTIVTNTARTKLKFEGLRGNRVFTDTIATESADDPKPGPGERLLADETKAQLAVHLGELDAHFGAGTRAIVDFRAQEFTWEEIVGIMQLADRTCRYRYEKALAWLTRRLSNQTAKEGQHD